MHLLVTSSRNGVVSEVSCWKMEICRLQATGLFYWVYKQQNVYSLHYKNNTGVFV